MTPSELGTVIALLMSAIGGLLAVLPPLLARRKQKAEAKTEEANTGKVNSEAAAIIVDSTMQLAARLDIQINALIAERDALKQERDGMNLIYDKRFLDLHTELAKTQEQLAMVLTQFDECRKKLEVVAFKAGVSQVDPCGPGEIN